MRKLWTLTLGVLLGGASLVPAQTPSDSPSRLPAPNIVSGGSLLSVQPAQTTTAQPAKSTTAQPAQGQDKQRLEPVPEFSHGELASTAGWDDGDNARFWVSGEYMLMWFKGGPTPPLVTTGNPNDPLAGTLAVGASSSTHVLFGAREIDYQTLSGFRGTIGGWCDSDRCVGVEASGFYIPQKSVGFSASGDAAGNPPIFVPAFQPQVAREGVFTISNPVGAVNSANGVGASGVTGSIIINAQTELWGSEINAVASVVRRDGFQMNALVGFRYMELRESLTLNAPNLFDFVNNISSSVADRFDTRNQFYGGQIGAWFACCRGILSAELTAKVALGDSHQVINVQGVTTESSPTGVAPTGTFPGGIFAQPTNIGRHFHEQLTVIPEIKVLGGINVLENVRVFVSYDFLYWNQVVRPGAEIDRSVNRTQSLGGPLVGPANPAPQYNRTDFWAQGVTAGFELRF
jgi:hypothetical protein